MKYIKLPFYWVYHLVTSMLLKASLRYEIRRLQRSQANVLEAERNMVRRIILGRSEIYEAEQNDPERLKLLKLRESNRERVVESLKTSYNKLSKEIDGMHQVLNAITWDNFKAETVNKSKS